VAKITVDGRETEAEVGAPLVEVLTNLGLAVPHLCYLEGRPPYAGCRTCLVEIEGARGLQLSCTAKVAEGMVVRTETEEVKEARKAVTSIILANHSDRCLTCHRRVKCLPGDICLRDDVVTHRCVTCSKNYRCELQTHCELVGMTNYEPWVGEARTYYQAEQPEADRANPFLEFDPQMCIICTRCVRACDEIRHTGAITLAGRGFSTRIEFGAGGPVHESNCDFCGACIDVCPTATLMEKPNKWIARTDEWVSTACNSCSVGCTLSMGVRNGRGVIIRPDPLNPVSFDQICVRGRFHYDAVRDRDRLSRHMVRRDEALLPASWEEALDSAAERLAETRRRHGPAAVGFLGSPVATNEENYLLQKLARSVVGTNNVDFSGGPVARSVAEALHDAFGSEALPADLSRVAQASALVVVADDLESSHNVAALRVKDAVVGRGARLLVVSPRYGEVCDFAEVWVRPRAGGEAAALAAVGAALAARTAAPEGVEGAPPAADSSAGGAEPDAVQRAAEFLASVAADLPDRQAGRQAQLAFLFAPGPVGRFAAGQTARAAANLAILCRGREASKSFYSLPTEANVHGARDMGVAPDLLPGLRPLGDAAVHDAFRQAWGAQVPPEAGLDFWGMIEAARQGRLKALVVAGDNPFLWAPGRQVLREALERLDFLLVIDGLMTETAERAHVLLADVPTYGKDGTYTSADRRVLRLKAALAPLGEAQPAWLSLRELGRRLAEKLSVTVKLEAEGPEALMREIASLVPAYAEARYDSLRSGRSRALPPEASVRVALQEVGAAGEAPAEGLLTLVTGRSLYTSLEGAALRSPEADKLHREESVEINPADAAALKVRQGEEVVLVNGSAELVIAASITEAVPPGVLYVSLYYGGGAVTALFPRDDGRPLLPQVRVAVRQPA
jgi:predicted molibdopterin-dependent oxidoreductase YjgC